MIYPISSKNARESFEAAVDNPIYWMRVAEILLDAADTLLARYTSRSDVYHAMLDEKRKKGEPATIEVDDISQMPELML